MILGSFQKNQEVPNMVGLMWQGSSSRWIGSRKLRNGGRVAALHAMLPGNGRKTVVDVATARSARGGRGGRTCR